MVVLGLFKPAVSSRLAEWFTAALTLFACYRILSLTEEEVWAYSILKYPIIIMSMIAACILIFWGLMVNRSLSVPITPPEIYLLFGLGLFLLNIISFLIMQKGEKSAGG
jgi:hypothetical protein